MARSAASEGREMRLMISESRGGLLVASNTTSSEFLLRPVATAPIRLFPDSRIVAGDNRSTRWYVSGLGPVAGLNSADFANNVMLPSPSSCASFSSCARFLFGYLTSKARKCSFLPAFCSASDELIPASVIRPSLDARFATDVTESSSRESSISAATSREDREVASRSVYQSVSRVVCRLYRAADDFVFHSTSTFTASTTDDQISAPIWVKFGAVDWVGESSFGVGDWARHCVWCIRG